MILFAALGPTEYAFLLVVLVLGWIAYGQFSRVRKAQRQVDECHAMLSELVREKRERE